VVMYIDSIQDSADRDDSPILDPHVQGLEATPVERATPNDEHAPHPGGGV